MDREELIKKHKKHFGVKPIIIDIYWREPKKVTDNILKALRDNIPYNEINLLNPIEKKAYHDGELLF